MDSPSDSGLVNKGWKSDWRIKARYQSICTKTRMLSKCKPSYFIDPRSWNSNFFFPISEVDGNLFLSFSHEIALYATFYIKDQILTAQGLDWKERRREAKRELEVRREGAWPPRSGRGDPRCTEAEANNESTRGKGSAGKGLNQTSEASQHLFLSPFQFFFNISFSCSFLSQPKA